MLGRLEILSSFVGAHRMKVLVLGSNPSVVPQRKNSTLDRLAGWMKTVGIAEYDFDNVIPHHVESESFNDVEFIRLYRMASKYTHIFSLGKFADEVLMRCNIVHYALPHPSPRNRQLNDSEFEVKVLQTLSTSGFIS